MGRDTPAEMAIFRQEKAATAAAKAEGKQRGVARIAELENCMADEDANDITPRPDFDQNQRRISHTASYAIIPMSFKEPGCKSAQDSDDFGPGPDREDSPRPNDSQDTDIVIVSSDEEDLTPRKKGKGVARKGPKPEDEGTNAISSSGGEDCRSKKKGKISRKATSRNAPMPDDEDADIVMSSGEENRAKKRAKASKEPVRGVIKTLRDGDGHQARDRSIDSEPKNLIEKSGSGKIRQVLHMFIHPTMLTLDETTLFYYSLGQSPLSRSTTKVSGLINNWAHEVEARRVSAKPGSKASIPNSASTLPPLTTASTKSSDKRSALSNEVAISTHSKRARYVVSDSEEEQINIGGLSDQDETIGTEREAAVLSPPKGKQRVTSAVSLLLFCTMLVYAMYRGSSRSRTAHKSQGLVRTLRSLALVARRTRTCPKAARISGDLASSLLGIGPLVSLTILGLSMTMLPW